jgi:hypothetical protein
MAASQLQCPIGGLGPGDLGRATIVVLANAPASFTFTANSLSSSQGTLTVNVSPAAVAVATADISVKAPVATLRPKVGRTARAGLQVLNGGPAADGTTTLSLTVPPQVRLVAAAPVRGTCDVTTLTCQLGSLPAQGSDLVVLTFRAVEPGKANVLAQVSSDVADATMANNQGTISVAIPKPPAKLKH